MRSSDHGGSHTILARTSPVPMPFLAARTICSSMVGPNGQPGYVRVKSTSTAASLTFTQLTRPRSTMLIPLSGSFTVEVVVLVCHPRKGSLTHAVAGRCAAVVEATGHRALPHDLYHEGFDPILAAQELDRGFRFDESVQGYGAELSPWRGRGRLWPGRLRLPVPWRARSGDRAPGLSPRGGGSAPRSGSSLSPERRAGPWAPAA